MHDEASYFCDHCGEEIVVPVDPTEGAGASYVEDCPVCCHPHVLRVESLGGGEFRITGRAE